jgi:uncharacterized membrane protein
MDQCGILVQVVMVLMGGLIGFLSSFYIYQATVRDKQREQIRNTCVVIDTIIFDCNVFVKLPMPLNGCLVFTGFELLKFKSAFEVIPPGLFKEIIATYVGFDLINDLIRIRNVVIFQQPLSEAAFSIKSIKDVDDQLMVQYGQLKQSIETLLPKLHDFHKQLCK